MPVQWRSSALVLLSLSLLLAACGAGGGDDEVDVAAALARAREDGSAKVRVESRRRDELVIGATGTVDFRADAGSLRVVIDTRPDPGDVERSAEDEPDADDVAVRLAWQGDTYYGLDEDTGRWVRGGGDGGGAVRVAEEAVGLLDVVGRVTSWRVVDDDTAEGVLDVAADDPVAANLGRTAGHPIPDLTVRVTLDDGRLATFSYSITQEANAALPRRTDVITWTLGDWGTEVDLPFD